MHGSVLRGLAARLALATTVLATTVLALTVTGASAQDAAASAALKTEIETLNRQMEAAFNRGDLLGVAAFYADDSRLLGPGQVVTGRTNVNEYWTKLKAPRSWTLDVLEVGGSRDSAWQWGRSTLVTGPEGKTNTSIVEFILLWKRQPSGDLKIYVDMYVSPPRPRKEPDKLSPPSAPAAVPASPSAPDAGR